MGQPECRIQPFRIMLNATGICLLALLVVMGIRMVGQSNEAQRRTGCKSNLSQIGKACGMYAEVPAHLGMFPLRLDMLYPDFIEDKRVLECPSGGARAHLPGQGKVEHSDYLYIPGHRDTHGIAGIAFCPHHLADGQGVQVLLGVGSVECLGPDSGAKERVRDMLEDSNISLEITPQTPPAEQRWKKALKVYLSP